jgi:hypothetical protein
MRLFTAGYPARKFKMKIFGLPVGTGNVRRQDAASAMDGAMTLARAGADAPAHVRAGFASARAFDAAFRGLTPAEMRAMRELAAIRRRFVFKGRVVCANPKGLITSIRPAKRGE